MYQNLSLIIIILIVSLLYTFREKKPMAGLIAFLFFLAGLGGGYGAYRINYVQATKAFVQDVESGKYLKDVDEVYGVHSDRIELKDGSVYLIKPDTTKEINLSDINPNDIVIVKYVNHKYDGNVLISIEKVDSTNNNTTKK